MSRLDRYAYHLMSIASIAQLVVVVTWFVQLFAAFEATGGMGAAATGHATLPIHFFGANVERLASAGYTVGTVSLALALLPSLLAAWWPWFQLRRFGRALYRHAPLSAPVARSLQWMGYSLVGSAVLTVIGTPLASALLTHGDIVSVDISTVFFIQTVAALCAFSMALIVREAVRVAEENKEFV